jgi:hypothetical protein
MPSLIRFLMIVGLIAGTIYAGIYSLAQFIEPQPREMVVTIPPDRFFKER